MPTTNPIPSREAICAMDGPALAHLASTLGLAPGSVAPSATGSVEAATGGAWCPWDDLAQAYALLASLEERGWSTHVHWYSPLHYGEIGLQVGLTVAMEGYETPDEKPLAILRCAVLAAAA